MARGSPHLSVCQKDSSVVVYICVSVVLLSLSLPVF